jgi:hypothetical protein
VRDLRRDPQTDDNPGMRRWIILSGMLVAAPSLGGCESSLVTGYQPRRLGDTPAVRRAYYAGKYTPEARAAEQEKSDAAKGRSGVPAPSVGPPAPY